MVERFWCNTCQVSHAPFDHLIRKKDKGIIKMLSMEDLTAMDNSNLEAQARNLHGAMYRRINTLQRDLNIARETLNNQRSIIRSREETIEKQRNYLTSLEEENRDLKELNARKWEENKPKAYGIAGIPPCTVTVQFPDENEEVIYKLVRE